MTQKVFVLLPAYNEQAALSRLVPEIAAVLRPMPVAWEILVINDGSTDGTESLINPQAKTIPVRLLTHPTNRGYGAALATGFQWVVEHGNANDVVVSLDSDRTHPPEYIPALVAKVNAGNEAVTASYVISGGAVSGVPLLRRVMSGIINALFRWSNPIPGAHTYTNGFRAYKVEILQRVSERFGGTLIEEPGFPGGVELFLKVGALNGRVSEVPFHLRYENRGGDSKIRLLSTIARYLKLIQRARTFRSR